MRNVALNFANVFIHGFVAKTYRSMLCMLYYSILPSMEYTTSYVENLCVVSIIDFLFILTFGLAIRGEKQDRMIHIFINIY